VIRVSTVNDKVLIALEGVRQVLVDERRPENDFYTEADGFLRTLHAELEERGLELGPLDDWDPRAVLAALEVVLLADRTLDADYTDVVKTIRKASLLPRVPHSRRKLARLR
jgi:hypothetical protein